MSNLRLVALVAVVLTCGACGNSSQPDENQQPVTPTPPPEFSYDGSGLIVVIPTEDGENLSALAGEIANYRIAVQKAESDIPVVLSTEGTVAGITVEDTADGTFLRIDGTQVAGGSTIPITVTAENTAKALSASADVVINVLELETIASGTLTRDGGAILSDGGAVGIQVDPGELSTNVAVEIKRAVTPNGVLKIRMFTDRDISVETALIRIISNREYVGDSTTALTGSSGKDKLMPVSAMAVEYPIDSSAPISSTTGLFELSSARWASIESVLGDLSTTCEILEDPEFGLFICLDLDPKATVLESTKPANCFGLDIAALVPDGCEQADLGAQYQAVLFVHGFEQSGALGGGEGTWGQFPGELSGYPTPDSATIVPFEFRWRTNASFRVVADDLGSAIARAYNLTGKPVHIVAHSFGGILVRTLLSEQAESGQSFDSSYVHSVTTLGTPHSGIYSEETTIASSNQTFPDGQDFGFMELCDQISCWQVGESGLVGDDYDESLLARFGAGPFGGLIQDLSAAEFTTQIPYVIGIGLEREEGANSRYGDGDKLITFNGQRVSPDLRGEYTSEGGSGWSVVRCGDTGYPLVTEVVLGTIDEVSGYSPDTVGPGTVPPNYKSTGQMTFGYSHSKGLLIDPDERFEYAEPHVELCAGTAPDCQDHSALELVKSVIDSSHEQSGLPYCISPPATAPRPSMEGYLGTYLAESPTKGAEITVRYTQVIGPGPEIYGGEVQMRGTFSTRIIRSTTDFGADYIDATYVDSGRASSAEFNGPVYEFEETSPRIIGATLDSASDFTEQEARVTYDGHKVWVNLEGVSIRVGDNFRVILKLER